MALKRNDRAQINKYKLVSDVKLRERKAWNKGWVYLGCFSLTPSISVPVLAFLVRPLIYRQISLHCDMFVYIPWTDNALSLAEKQHYHVIHLTCINIGKFIVRDLTFPFRRVLHVECGCVYVSTYCTRVLFFCSHQFIALSAASNCI